MMMILIIFFILLIYFIIIRPENRLMFNNALQVYIIAVIFCFITCEAVNLYCHVIPKNIVSLYTCVYPSTTPPLFSSSWIAMAMLLHYITTDDRQYHQ